MIPNVNVFDSYYLLNVVDNDEEYEVTTKSYITPLDWKKLLNSGWVRREPNVAAYIKEPEPKENDVPYENE